MRTLFMVVMISMILMGCTERTILLGSTTISNSTIVYNTTNNITNNITHNISSTGNLTIAGNLNITDNIIVGGNVSMKRPYGMFSDNTTQSIINNTVAQAVNFSTVEDAYLIIKTGSTNFSVQQTGDYLIDLSIIYDVSAGIVPKHLDIWIRKNGIDIPRSNTKVSITNMNEEGVLSVPFIIDLNTTDVFQVMMAGDGTTVRLLYTPAQTDPIRPETPSIIMTMTKISELTT